MASRHEWARNFALNAEMFMGLPDWPGRIPEGEPVMVTGAGWSLNDAVDLVEGFDGMIISGTSELEWFDRHGIMPDVAVVVDEHPAAVIRGHMPWKAGDSMEEMEAEREKRSAHYHAFPPMLVHPCVSAAVQEIPNELYRYGAIAGDMPWTHGYRDMWEADPLQVRDAFVVSNVQVALAVMAGATEIHLVGVDYGHVDGFHRWDAEVADFDKGADLLLNLPDGPVWTNEVWLLARRALYNLADSLEGRVFFVNHTRGILQRWPTSGQVAGGE